MLKAGDARRRLSSLAIDIHSSHFPQILKEIHPDIVIHARGPFQGQDYQVPKACIYAGCHYIDLADDRLVEFKRGKSPSLMGLEAFKRELPALYGGRTVDVATPAILKNPYRRKSIEKDPRVIYDA